MWARMLRLAWRDPHPAGRRRMLSRLLVFVPLVASFHAVCFFLDGILFPGLHRVRVRAPVFLVGHARSGTTLLHRLMSRDAERFSSFLLYELYFPSLLQKKAIRALAAFDRRLARRLLRAPRAGVGEAALRRHAGHPRHGPHPARGGRLPLLLVLRVGHLDAEAARDGRDRLLPPRSRARAAAPPRRSASTPTASAASST